MNLFGAAIGGYVTAFKDKNVLKKHIILFLLIGFVAFVRLLLSDNVIKIEDIVSNIPLFSIIGILLIIAATIIGIYAYGYILEFIHNSFKENLENYLPELDSKPFGIVFGAVPIMLCWMIYLSIPFLIVGIMVGSSLFLRVDYGKGGIVFIILLILLYAFLANFIQLFYVGYSKEYNCRGFFNIALPFRYMKYCFWDYVLLGLIFMVISLLIFLPLYCLFFVLKLLLSGITFFLADCLLAIVSAYVVYVTQLAWYYGLVQIYKEKIETNIDME